MLAHQQVLKHELQQNCAARHAALSRIAFLRLAWAGLRTAHYVSAHLSSHCSSRFESANSSAPDSLPQRAMLGVGSMLPLEAADCAGAAILTCVHVSSAIARGRSQVHGADDASILGRAILCRVQISLEAMQASSHTPSFMSSLPLFWCCLHTPLTTLIEKKIQERRRDKRCALGPSNYTLCVKVLC